MAKIGRCPLHCCCCAFAVFECEKDSTITNCISYVLIIISYVLIINAACFQMFNPIIKWRRVLTVLIAYSTWKSIAYIYAQKELIQ